MPSIMDLVREYSELEIRRNERGGMLEPQAEIRYQALKFFLEFELFPMPAPKPVEYHKPLERKKTVSSGEIKKQVEIQHPTEEVKNIEKREEIVNTEGTSNTTPDLVSVISETSLPVADNPQPIDSPSEELSHIENPIVTESPLSQKNEEIAVVETKEETNADNTEVLEMVDAIDGAVDSIIVADSPVQEDSQQSIAEPIISPVEQIIENTTAQPVESKEDNIELSLQIDNAIDNAIKIEEKVDNQAVIKESENVLANIVETGVEQNNTPIPEIAAIETIQPVESIEEVSPAPKENLEVPILNIEEILNPSEGISQPTAEPSAPTLNIEEIVAVTEKADHIPPPENTNSPTAPQIDFLSGLGLSSESIAAPVQTEQPAPPAEQSIKIEDILPEEIISDVIPVPTSTQGRVLIETPSKAAIHMIDGDVRRGIIKDLNDSQTEVELFYDETMQNSTKIPTSEIKAIFFMRQGGEKSPSPSNGVTLNVKFKDDRTISGISNDYSESAKVFTLIPADSGQLAKLIVIYSEFVEDVEKI